MQEKISEELKTKLDNKLKKIIHNPLFKIAIFSSTSMTVLGSVVISPSLPELQAHFKEIPDIEVLSKLILTLPALFVMLFSPLSGFLLDKYGRVKFLFPAMILWSIAGSVGFFLDNVYYLLISRAIFGIATAFIMTSASALLGDYYRGEDRQKALGLQGFATAVGSAVFISLGGYLSSIDWRYPFLVYLLGIVIFIIAYIKLFEPPKSLKKSKITSTLDSISSMEKFKFFRFLPIYFLAFLCMVIYYISPTQIPFFITHHLGKSSNIVGISMSASAIAYGIFSLFYSRVRNIMSINKVYSLCFFLMGTCFILLFIFDNYIIVMISLMFLGAGGGMFIVNNSAYLLKIAPDKQRAKALGFLSSSIFLGQFSSPLISQPIVDKFNQLELFLFFGIFIYICSLFYMFKKDIK